MVGAVYFDQVPDHIPKRRWWQFWKRYAAVAFYTHAGAEDLAISPHRPWFDPWFRGPFGARIWLNAKSSAGYAIYKWRPSVYGVKAFLLWLFTLGMKQMYTGCHCHSSVKFDSNNGHWCWKAGYKPNPAVNHIVAGINYIQTRYGPLLSMRQSGGGQWTPGCDIEEPW